MNSGGRDHQEVGVGNSEGRSGRLATAGDTSTEPSSLTQSVSRQEPPYTEPYVRWCERSVDELIIYLLLDPKTSKIFLDYTVMKIRGDYE